MNEYCDHDILLLDLCSECFKNCSNGDSNWITEVCSKSHRVVWAKIGKHPYWPAKVMREDIKGSFKYVTVQFFSEKMEINQTNTINIREYQNYNTEMEAEGNCITDFEESVNVSERKENFSFYKFQYTKNLIFSL